ncbi:MAG: hypothetical protein ACI3XN_08530 [Eubacteriales bacterium]
MLYFQRKENCRPHKQRNKSNNDTRTDGFGGVFCIHFALADIQIGGTTVTEAPGKRLCDDEDREYNTCCRIAECGKLPVLR